MTLPYLPQDKANHALYGAAIYIVGSFAAGIAGSHPQIVGLVLAVFAGVAKEAADWWSNRLFGEPLHGVEWQDAAATAGGGVLAWLAGVTG